MRGLLKAYLLDSPTGEWISRQHKTWPKGDRYIHQPERLGMTIAYGEMPDEALALVGTIIQLKTDRIIYGEMTSFAICGLAESEMSAQIHNIRSQMPIHPKPLHMTLGWADGGAPAQAGDECAKFWRDVRAVDLAPADYCQKTLTATIEFQNFEAT